MLNLTQQGFADLIGRTPRRVRQLIKQGAITRPVDGRYRDEHVREFTRYVAETQQANAKNRDLIEREKHRALKRENDLAEKLVAPVELLETVVAKGSAALITGLKRLPDHVKRVCPEFTDDHIKVVNDAVSKCRAVLRGMKLELEDS